MTDPDYRYLLPEEDEDLLAPTRGIAWGLVIGPALWFLFFLAALFLVPLLTHGGSP